ncbi:hypothetical protein [Streptomyces sp. NPDC059224]|uniref:hypothetical protein n=1 Tax=Streptomyces sp. NPDC059224 TaxID=3346775 RepID=UPI00369A6691
MGRTGPARPVLEGRTLTRIDSAASGPDGHALAVGAARGQGPLVGPVGDVPTRLWDMTVDDAIDRICAVTRKTLTPGGRQRDVGDIPG